MFVVLALPTMEAFSLLKVWRGCGGGVGVGVGVGGVFTRDNPQRAAESSPSFSSATTIVTTVTPSSSSYSGSGSGSDDEAGNDDGPFYDLEFVLPDDSSDSENPIKDQDGSSAVVQESENLNTENESDENEAAEIKLTLSSAAAAETAFPNNKFPFFSILKSAAKLRVQMPKFNKSKSGEKPNDAKLPRKEEGGQDAKPSATSKLLTVKLKMEEVMPIVSMLFTKDHNTKAVIKGNEAENRSGSDGSDNGDDKKFSKDVMQKYLRKVKPLYVRVSNRNGSDKLKLSGQLSFPPPKPAAAGDAEGAGAAAAEVGILKTSSTQKQGNLQAGLRVVCKHLGKSRSASASVLAPAVASEASRRRDDSLLQQQDGIQSAILHCKRPFNASRDMEASILSRSVSR